MGNFGNVNKIIDAEKEQKINAEITRLTKEAYNYYAESQRQEKLGDKCLKNLIDYTIKNNIPYTNLRMEIRRCLINL